jgi:hypothetical protein
MYTRVAEVVLAVCGFAEEELLKNTVLEAAAAAAEEICCKKARRVEGIAVVRLLCANNVAVTRQKSKRFLKKSRGRL